MDDNNVALNCFVLVHLPFDSRGVGRKPGDRFVMLRPRGRRARG
jgi:hypothetical protein